MHSLLFLFVLANSVYAAPVFSRDSTGVAGASAIAALTVFVIITAILLALVLFKYAFIRHRQLQARLQTHKIEESPRLDSSGLFQRHSKPSFRKLEGFFVGFLGSPEWETRQKPRLDRTAFEERVSVIHANSGSRKSTGRKSSSEYKDLSTNTKRTISSDYSSISESTRVSRARSLKLAKVPPHTRPESASKRISFPAAYLERFNNTPKPRRDVSPRSRAEAEDLLSQVSLRLVERSVRNDAPLPLSPKTPVTPTPSAFYSKAKLHTSQEDIPPLPSLPAESLSGAVNLPPATPIAQSPTPVHISHPYALTPSSATVNKTRLQPKMNRYSQENTRIRYSYLQDVPMPKPLEVNRPNPNACTFAEPPRRPLSPVTKNQLNVQVPLQKSSPPQSPLPVLSVPAAAVTRQNKRNSRSKRLSNVGPSPLRAMTLPGTISAPSINPIPEAKENTSVTPDIKASRRSRAVGLPRKSIFEEDDGSAMLVDKIRELVEDTQKWDSSLYMDPGFESLVRQPELAKSGYHSMEAAQKSGTSIELDLGTPALGDVNERLDAVGSNLVSFWEDGGWKEGERKRQSVGVAW